MLVLSCWGWRSAKRSRCRDDEVEHSRCFAVDRREIRWLRSLWSIWTLIWRWWGQCECMMVCDIQDVASAQYIFRGALHLKFVFDPFCYSIPASVSTKLDCARKEMIDSYLNRLPATLTLHLSMVDLPYSSPRITYLLSKKLQGDKVRDKITKRMYPWSWQRKIFLVDRCLDCEARRSLRSFSFVVQILH